MPQPGIEIRVHPKDSSYTAIVLRVSVSSGRTPSFLEAPDDKLMDYIDDFASQRFL